MQESRPVFLEPWRIKLPLSGVVSILHRISGVLMALSIPAAAALFHQALSGQEGFDATVSLLDFWLVKLLLLALIWSLLHHFLVGIRHLFLDIGVGLDRSTARKTAWVALIGALILLPLLIAFGG